MSSGLVFITGATGFIGAHVLDHILQAGYRARVSVRKREQIQNLKARHPAYIEHIDFVVVSDITNPRFFVEVLSDVDHIVHLASPLPGAGEDLKKDYVEPAVKGTEAILIAAAQYPGIKTVIIESSVLSLTPVDIWTMSDVSVTDNTNEIIPVDIDMKFPPNNPSHVLKYTISKILAHQATRDFMQKHSPNFKLITFHPVFVLGPDINQTSSETIAGINAYLWNNLTLSKPIIPSTWVHVHDVAEAHVRVLKDSTEDKIASGTEFLLSAPPFEYSVAVEYIKNKYPDVDVRHEGPFDPPWRVDASTASDQLGIEWKDWKVMIDDVFGQQLSFRK